MDKTFNYGISVLIFSALLFTGIMPPAPTSFFDLSMFVFLILVLIATGISFFQKINTNIETHNYNKFLFFFLLLYLVYLLYSFCIGFWQLFPHPNALRSIGPYVLFLPFLLLICLRRYQFKISHFTLMLIACGLLQAIDCIYLYFQANQDFFTLIHVMALRITLIDARCTIPFILASAIIPIHYFFKSNSPIWLRGIALSVVVISALGSVVTSTRSIILSMFVGWIVYFIFLAIYREKVFQVSTRSLLKQLMWFGILLILVFIIFNMQESTHAAFQAFSARSLPNKSVDYTTGRLYGEWIPALSAWWHSSSFNNILGLGAGVGFHTDTGELRTYIHNLMIYGLVYGGVFGLIAVFGIYGSLFYSLIRKALIELEPLYFMLAAFLCSLFFYAQLFAVHKLFSYNLIFILLVGVAMRAPKDKIKPIH